MRSLRTLYHAGTVATAREDVTTCVSFDKDTYHKNEYFVTLILRKDISQLNLQMMSR